MRARQKEGERSLFGCQRTADSLMELAKLLYTETNLGDGDNNTHT